MAQVSHPYTADPHVPGLLPVQRPVTPFPVPSPADVHLLLQLCHHDHLYSPDVLCTT